MIKVIIDNECIWEIVASLCIQTCKRRNSFSSLTADSKENELLYIQENIGF